MTATANAAAVKAALTITARIAGTAVPVHVSGGLSLSFTRHATATTAAVKRYGASGTVATARVAMQARADGRGRIPEDVLGRIVKARGDLQVVPDGIGLRFLSGGVDLGTTVPEPDAELQRVGWPGTALVHPAAIRVEADYANGTPAKAREVVEALQGVAAAAASERDPRAVLSAVLLDRNGEAVATDSYRLHVAEVAAITPGPEVGNYPEALVPAYVLQAVPAGKVQGFRLAAIPHGIDPATWGMAVRLRYGTSRNPVAVTIDAHGPTVAGPYPRWRQLVPAWQTDDRWQAPTGTYVLPDGMAETVKAVQAKGPTLVQWSEGATAVKLQAMADETGTRRLYLPDGGAAATVGTATTGSGDVILNGAYLAPAVAFAGPGATVEVREALKPVTFAGRGRTAVVMPMRGGTS